MTFKIHMRKVSSGLGFLSPGSFAMMSYAVFLVSLFIPPGFYAGAMREKNYIFLDVVTFTFVTICVLAFLLGTKLNSRGAPTVLLSKPVASPLLIGIVLSMAMALDILSVSLLVKNNPSFLTYIFSGDEDAEQIRNYLDYSSALAEALPFLIATLFWANYRRTECEILCNRRSRVLNLLLLISALVAIATCVLKLARYELMPLIFGFWLSRVTVKIRYGVADRRSVLSQALVLVALILGVFLIFSWIRGYQESGALTRSMLGYGPASYNRLALVLEGTIQVPTMGSGVNVFPGIYHIPLVSRFIDLTDTFGVLPVDVARAAEFSAVGRSGLDPAFNWVTTFGYVFYDFSWFSPLYFLAFGMLAGKLWSAAKAGRVLGIVLYPFLVFSILLWFSSNYFFRSSVFTWIVVVFLVAAAERVSRLKARS